MPNDKIASFRYLKGADFTGNVKHLTQCKDFTQLSLLLNIPKSTFSTWNSHQRTPHELIVRLHLALGIPVKDLALAQNSQLTEIHPSLRDDHLLSTHIQDQTGTYQTPATKNQQHATVILKSYTLHQGQLIESEKYLMPFVI
ncbi:helix-turn-helix domain-containing protein [Vibrio sp. PP-XX7]